MHIEFVLTILIILLLMLIFLHYHDNYSPLLGSAKDLKTLFYIVYVMEDKTRLTKEEIQKELENLSNWIYKNNSLEMQWQFFKFSDLIDFLKKVITTMDKQNHHSDLILDTKNKIIKVSVTTHSENAVTRADVEFAKALNKLS